MSNPLKSIAKGIGKVFKAVGKFVKKVISSKLFKIAAIAAAVVGGGMLLAGAGSGAGAGAAATAAGGAAQTGVAATLAGEGLAGAATGTIGAVSGGSFAPMGAAFATDATLGATPALAFGTADLTAFGAPPSLFANSASTTAFSGAAPAAGMGTSAGPLANAGAPVNSLNAGGGFGAGQTAGPTFGFDGAQGGLLKTANEAAATSMAQQPLGFTDTLKAGFDAVKTGVSNVFGASPAAATPGSGSGLLGAWGGMDPITRGMLVNTAGQALSGYAQQKAAQDAEDEARRRYTIAGVRGDGRGAPLGQWTGDQLQQMNAGLLGAYRQPVIYQYTPQG